MMMHTFDLRRDSLNLTSANMYSEILSQKIQAELILIIYEDI